MKAKDIKWCPQHGYPLPCNKCGMPLSKTDQKEIYKAGFNEALNTVVATQQYDEGKKAGIKEVVECIKEIARADKKLPILNVDGIDYTVLLCEDWQAKLKEWNRK